MAVEESTALTSIAAVEIILAIIVSTIFVFAATAPDSFSNYYKFYAQEDLTLLSDTMLASPGSIEYDYEIKEVYSVSIDDTIKVTRSSSSVAANYQTYTLHFERAQDSSNLEVKKVA